MHLMVEISEARVEAGQPHSEIIVVDSKMAWPGFSHEPFVETARFQTGERMEIIRADIII